MAYGLRSANSEEKSLKHLDVHSYQMFANIDIDGVTANQYNIKTTMGSVHGNELKGIVHAESEVGNINLKFKTL